MSVGDALSDEPHMDTQYAGKTHINNQGVTIMSSMRNDV